MNGNYCKIIVLYILPFDKLRTNGIHQSFLNNFFFAPLRLCTQTAGISRSLR